MPSTQALHHAVWPRRLPHAITVPRTSLWFNLEANAIRYPDKPATVFFDQVITYAQLRDAALRLAAWLHRQGVRAGDRVILLMQNCPQHVIAYYGILRANAVVVPVNPMNKADELGHYITDPGARVAIVAADLADELLLANQRLPEGQRLQRVLCAHYADLMPADALAGEAADVPPAWREWLARRHPLPEVPSGQAHDWAEAMACTAAPPEHTAGPDDLVVLPYTSGTTGLPKGCMHPHRTLMHNAVASTLWGNGSAENVALVVVPMFHITGMVIGMHGNIYAGATMVIMPRWDRELAGRLISRWKVTHWVNIPTMIIDLLASPNFASHDLTSLVYIGGGGAAMPQAVAQKLLDLYGLRYVEGYGLTETAAPSHNNPPDHPKQQCLGVPFIGTDARIVDPQTLQECPVGEQGEIVIHGPEVFDGYWQRPDATAAAFFELDGKRFFRTGDLGRMDEQGYFFITDRLKRMINASGYKVWPAEVEALMFKHPAIAEACVIGVQDAYRGETVKAVVVLRDEARGQVSEQDIIDWCHEHMAAYKVPRIVAFADALPKSGSGKVMWRLLQEAEARAR
ncbi:long-chain fatty acid--CoA ligase [Tepidicella baoligensis]|uniref:long-chain fatty acid--CoA ligase n=1 Tax=Tepidicella baoligensis TaxID=2707016 RepID=UPI0015DA38BE|nr:long-chain fatty acid--CoA ligase [Tepidicella baoligensis]